jgi:ketosteroid isomerase-like protein
MPDAPMSAEVIAGQVHAALGAGDLSAFSHLLSPDVTWGAPDAKQPTCRNREQVMDWYRRGWESGTRARVVEVSVHGDDLLVGMMVERDGAQGERWQVLRVGALGVTDIRGFEDRRSAEARCEVSPAR